MIVADTNLLVSLFLPSQDTAAAEQLLQEDSQWAAPLLWRSEFRNVLALYVRKELLSFEQAYATQIEAERLVKPNEFELDSFYVLKVTASSTLSAYDAEFVALAEQLRVYLATLDNKILSQFPEIACSPQNLVS